MPKREGMTCGKVLTPCPLNWKMGEANWIEVLQEAIDSCFSPLYEVEHGQTTITYDPDALGRRRPARDWLKNMGKTRHMLRPENAADLESLEAEIDRRWRRLKAMHEHPEL